MSSPPQSQITQPLLQPLNISEDESVAAATSSIVYGDGHSHSVSTSEAIPASNLVADVHEEGEGSGVGDGTGLRRRHASSISQSQSDAHSQHKGSKGKKLTLEERHSQLNSLFGTMPWKSHVQKRPLETHSRVFQELYEAPNVPKTRKVSMYTIGNISWVILFGWWLALVYYLCAVVLLFTIAGYSYSRRCAKLGGYFFFPFGKHLFRVCDDGDNADLLDVEGHGHSGHEDEKAKPRLHKKTSKDATCGSYIAATCWYIFGAPILVIAHGIVLILCWFVIVFIPMAKVNRETIWILLEGPNDIGVSNSGPGTAPVVLCTYQAINVNYYKYHVMGMNVVLVNMLAFVIVSIVLGYGLKLRDHVLLFFLSLFSIVPLAYYIGMAISSISAQSNFAVGATLNAAFGSLIELILYYFAIREGLGNVVKSSVVGSLLGTLLLLPGLAMVFGGIKRKTNNFNAQAAGVSSVLLITAIIGAFTPTIFYQAHGQYSLHCQSCLPNLTNTTSLACGGCHYVEQDYGDDPAYGGGARPLMWIVASLMPIGYIVGLIFTMKTHTDVIYPENDWGDEQPPEWSKLKCVVILLVSTALFAVVSELLVSSIQPVLVSFGVSQRFIGVTLIALVPNTAEFVNAIQFALQDNMSLALEIGSTAAVQISLLQVPFLVFLSAILSTETDAFTLIFSSFTVYAIVFAVIVFNQVMDDGRADYFQGFALLIIYVLLICAYMFSGNLDT